MSKRGQEALGRRCVVVQSTTRWFVGSIYFLLAAAAAFSLAVSRSSPARTALFALAIAAFLSLAVRALRSAILAAPSGVIARADRFTRRLAWSEIDRFELRSSGLTRSIGAWKTDGSWVRLMDCGHDSRQQYEAAASDLGTELGRRR